MLRKAPIVVTKVVRAVHLLTHGVYASGELGLEPEPIALCRLAARVWAGRSSSND